VLAAIQSELASERARRSTAEQRIEKLVGNLDENQAAAEQAQSKQVLQREQRIQELEVALTTRDATLEKNAHDADQLKNKISKLEIDASVRRPRIVVSQ